MAKRRGSSGARAPLPAPPPARPRPIALAVGAAVLIAAAALAWRVVHPGPAAPSLLLITIDTLRADHVGAYGAKSGATPTLDALAAAGTRFDQVQTAVPLTGPSHATILTGVY